MGLFIGIILFGMISQYTDGYSNHYKYSLGDFPNELGSVPCPDGQSSCPDDQTCCQLSSGQYGCCPIPNAICCNDHLHCCPNRYTCDVTHSRCQKGFEQSQSVVCPEGDMSCSDGETCCQLQSGDYGCCPLPDAVCCSDYSHCCPHQYTCDIEHNKCNKDESIPWFTKTAARPIDKQVLRTVQCPDEKSFCPEETTCCEMIDGSYGCCPYNQASCCSDKIHCCGNGYSCDQSGSRCIRHFKSINSTNIQSHEKLFSLIVYDEQTCPDGITKCSSTSTCCPNEENNQITYSCCPYSRGVCCGSNGSICCPFKYICDQKQLTCQLNQTISSYKKCGQSNTDLVCLSNETCCQSNDDQYTCCAFDQGVCCDDGRHCCSKGTKCDQISNGCIQQ